MIFRIDRIYLVNPVNPEILSKLSRINARFSPPDVSRYNAPTCYQARDISKLLVSLAIKLPTHRGVKRAEKCRI